MLNSDWLSDSIMNGDWLYFSHVKNAHLIGRIAFFTGENIAHIEFYLQGLLPKILAIYTIKEVSQYELIRSSHIRAILAFLLKSIFRL